MGQAARIIRFIVYEMKISGSCVFSASSVLLRRFVPYENTWERYRIVKVPESDKKSKRQKTYREEDGEANKCRCSSFAIEF